MTAAVIEEESELSVALRPRPATTADVVTAPVALVVIISSSVVMERAAVTIGGNHRVAGIVIGALVLAAVTSLPNLVAGVYLAARGRGAASLSTTLSSNTCNVALGLLVPAAVVGLARPSGPEIVVVAWYGALTVVTLVLAFTGRGLGRLTGAGIVAGYLGFVAVLLAIT
jgi:cation:H+ antiporter